MKKIKLISTGGTIAMGENKEGKLIPKFTGKELIESIPELEEMCEVEVNEFCNIDSSQMTPERMFKLAQLVKEEIRNSDIDGIVITHGTDTLQETAYMLNVLIDSSKPVIITGAMRGATELGSDGSANIYQAFKVAVKEKSKDQGVLVVLNNEIHTAHLLTKRHTTNLAAFRSTNSGRLGEVTKEEVNYFYKTMPPKNIKTDAINTKVAFVKIVSGFNSTIIDMLVSNNEFDGLIIEAFGSGTIPNYILPSLERALNKGMKVVLTSRCLEGKVHNTYAAAGGDKDLEEMGVIFSDGISGPKARIKLMLLLGGDYKDEEICDFFKEA
ncbi:asparaginase [Selenihalanaerobacter shriftii]|uniref:asparaginase n=1 Tax=Selenihalanaerobacter shriftii TaxID=142842 RepID=A0A1T4MNK5_9FIRM|nr:asparaginase [Selenihalanaerobacter shriftii]SJZ68629.1 L-asparaginase [Selenihalanaerobacter shriftii]